MHSHPRSLRIAFPFLKVVLAPILFLLGGVRVKGAYRLPLTGPVLVLSNHLSNMDPIVCQYASPRLGFFMAKRELFDIAWLRPVLNWFCAFPVSPRSADRSALKRAIELLKHGQMVWIYPEGGTNGTGDLAPLLPGASLLIKHTGAPVICVGLIGTDRMIPANSMVPRPAFRAVQLNWGEVHQFPEGASRESIMEWVEDQLRNLAGYEKRVL